MGRGLTPVVWFTGLSGAGKSTICAEVERILKARALRVAVLDGDEIRKHLCADLGYSREDRTKNLWRISYVAGLLAEHEVVVLVAAISPYEDVRRLVRRSHACFLEVYVNAPLEVCEARDTKGLYRKARAGLIQNFTGISDLYETPLHPDVECRTDRESLAESCEKVIAAISSAMMKRGE